MSTKTEFEIKQELTKLKDKYGEKLTLSLCMKNGLSRRSIERYFGDFNSAREFLGLKIKPSVKGKIRENLAKEELDRRLLALREKYGESLTLEICKKEGCTARTIKKYYKDFNEVRSFLGLSLNKSNNHKAKANQKLTRADVESKIKILLAEYGNKLTTKVLEDNGISINLVKKFFGSFSELKREFRIEASSQDAFLNYVETVLNVQVQREVSFPDLINPKTGKHLRFDGYIKELNILIEYDDITHFEEIGRFSMSLVDRQEKDKFKDKWAEDKGIKLVRFNYKEPFNKEYILRKLSLEDANIPAEKCYSIHTYRGVSKQKDKYTVTILTKDFYAYLGAYDSEEYAAIIREKFIRENNLLVIHNDISQEVLERNGFKSWKDVPLYNINRAYSSKYFGVRFHRNGWVAEVSMNKKTLYISRSASEIESAIAREKWLDAHPACRCRRNKIEGYNC